VSVIEPRAAGALQKVPTGIAGLDEVLHGGLPAGRTTLVCGGPGCGKTLLGLEWLARGCREQDEPAVFLAFEEPTEHLVANAASLGLDVAGLVDEGRLVLDRVRLDGRAIAEAGDYDLEALFIRIEHAMTTVGARRVVLDTIEALFSAFPSEAILRSELRRLFGWLGERGVTSIVTAERGDRHLTRFGIEEYVSDCVITLDHRVDGEISTRRLRIVKFRGSEHATNEFPFVIGRRGLSVLPITGLSGDLPASTDRMSTGVPGLDAMLGGEGVWRGSSVLISGTAGSGKTTLACAIADAACRRGERVLLLLLEESTAEVRRNLAAVGVHLDPHLDRGLLRCRTDRPSAFGLEEHLVAVFAEIREADPSVVVVDAASAFPGPADRVTSALRRLVDLAKASGATVVLTSLTDDRAPHLGMSSAMDTWIALSDVERAGERNRAIQVLKARGLPHSNQVREFVLSAGGLELRDVYVGPGGVLMGAARLQQEARIRARDAAAARRAHGHATAFEHHRTAVEAEIARLRAQLDAEAADLEAVRTAELDAARLGAGARDELRRLREGPGREDRA
jgi:circadian clock protein KaiC